MNDDVKSNDSVVDEGIENNDVIRDVASSEPMDPERYQILEEALRDVVDPELGINVVDLGLLYGLREDSTLVTVEMTLTSAACPLTGMIEDQARQALLRTGLASDVRIQWVWMPPWGPERITDDGREQLRALGFRV